MATPPRRRLVEGASSVDWEGLLARSMASRSLQTEPNGLTPRTDRSCASESANFWESLECGDEPVARLCRTPRTRTAIPVPVGTTSTAARADQYRPEFSTIP